MMGRPPRINYWPHFNRIGKLYNWLTWKMVREGKRAPLWRSGPALWA